MIDEIENAINEQDTSELFSTLVGQVVMKHESINAVIREGLVVLERKLLQWRTAGTTERHELSMGGSNSRWVHPMSIHFNTLSDADLRGVFIDFVRSWHDIQSSFLEFPGWFDKFPDFLNNCFNEENRLRNEIVHSGYKFKVTNKPLESMAKAKHQKGFGKKRGQIELTNIKRTSLIEFTGFQSELLKFLNDFIQEEVDEEFMFDASLVLMFKQRFSNETVQYVQKMLGQTDKIYENESELAEFLSMMEGELMWDEQADISSFYYKIMAELQNLQEQSHNLSLKEKDSRYVKHVFDAI